MNKVSDEWPEMGMIAVSPYTPIVRNYNTPHIDVGGYQNGVEYMTYMGKSYYNWCTNGFTAGLGIPPPGPKFADSNTALENITRGRTFYPVSNSDVLYRNRGGYDNKPSEHKPDFEVLHG